MVPPPSVIQLPLGERPLPFSGAPSSTMAAQRPLRVLCLAGFRQSERGFREKTGALRKALRGRAQLVCLSGPHPIVDAAGPLLESGERSPVPEMRYDSSLPGLVSVTPSAPLTLYSHSFLPPSRFILPISVMSATPAFQISTLICATPSSLHAIHSVPNLTLPRFYSLSLADSSCHSQTSLSHFFPPAFPFALTPFYLPYRCRALPSGGAASRLVVFRTGDRRFLRTKRAHSVQRSGGSAGNGGTGTEHAGTFRRAPWFQPGSCTSSLCVCPRPSRRSSLPLAEVYHPGIWFLSSGPRPPGIHAAGPLLIAFTPCFRGH